jgi:hypothetical protein
MMKLKLFTLLISLLSAGEVYATSPVLTNVSATLQDSSAQVWHNATWTTTFIPPFGNPSTPNNNGNPITANQSGVANFSGAFSVTLDDNNVVAPAGSKWKFTICPNATVSACSEVQLIITGPSMDISAALNSALQPPVVSAQPSISRGYNDTEVNGSFGALYINSTDNSLRQCEIIFCQGTGWVVITVPTNNPVFTGTLTVPCVKFDTIIPTDDTTVCGQAPVGHINVLLPAISGTLAELDSPAFTGTPTAPTPPTADNSTRIATTAYVQNQGYVTASTAPVTSVFGRTGAVVAQSGDYSVAQVTGAAPINSPTFTGIPAAPTAAPGTSTTQIATTAFVQAAVAATNGILAASTTSCSGCPITYSNTLTTIISHAITFPSSGCPCRVYGYYNLYLTTGNSGTDAAEVTDGTNIWAGGNANTTGGVGSGATYGLSGAGWSPVTYANNASVTFSVKSANSHSGGVTANLNVGSDITAGPFPDSSLNLVVIASQ